MTQFRLWNVIRLNSKYSIRLYEILKMLENEGIYTKYFEMDELRETLSVEPDKLLQFSHFRKTVIEKAKKDLAELTDINFTWEPTKGKKNKVIGVTFHITKNRKFLDNILSKLDDIEVASILMNFNFTLSEATEIVKLYGDVVVKENVRKVIGEYRVENNVDLKEVILKSLIECAPKKLGK